MATPRNIGTVDTHRIGLASQKAYAVPFTLNGNILSCHATSLSRSGIMPSHTHIEKRNVDIFDVFMFWLLVIADEEVPANARWRAWSMHDVFYIQTVCKSLLLFYHLQWRLRCQHGLDICRPSLRNSLDYVNAGTIYVYRILCGSAKWNDSSSICSRWNTVQMKLRDAVDVRVRGPA